MTIIPGGAGACAPASDTDFDSKAPLAPMPAPVPGGWRAFCREDVARLHRLYYDPTVQVGAIAEVFRVSTSTLLRWIAEMKWPSRRQMKREACDALRSYGQELRAQAESAGAFAGAAQDRAARESAHAEHFRISAGLDGLAQRAEAVAPPVLLPSGFDDAAPVDFPELVKDIERAVRREIALTEQNLHDPSPGARERNARVLSTLVKTLQGLAGLVVKDLRAQPQDKDEEEPPTSRERMDRLRQELTDNLRRIQAQQDQAKSELYSR